ncbi:glucose-6-phosphate isomerase [Candidatus Pelagibacter bacterium nBUS_25]|uniref:glucose-6-phosphate isomerase n=1 Tax=Candidatus Pelagibacter bacterium nBUS_25 TaxID=3374187 RepID=UPI003EBA01A8
MFTKNISFKNFLIKKKHLAVKKNLNLILNERDQVIHSLSKSYKDSFNKKNIKHFNKKLDYRIIGMGGSTLGSQAIYDFLKKKIKKNFIFVDNLNAFKNKKAKKNFNNLIISKSGNTIETIVNANILVKKKDKNLFITEKKESYLSLLAQKLKADVVDHNNYIGGRYSVLSEVGMIPAELMGLNYKNFRQLNNLVKNKYFMRALVSNVEATIYFLKAKKFNSVVINYDEQSTNLFNWYQQLIAESLGKKNNGILPIVSVMPKDNHSVMQLYLDGFKNNFFTFFYSYENNSAKINNNSVLSQQKFLKNKNINQIMFAQKKATEVVFKKKNIPFRSFEIKKRDEKTLGELFCFFILETILIGKALKINPYDQPAVEFIKKETKKILF